MKIPDRSRLRIAQILPSLEIGGMERLAVDLALQQMAAGHEPFIYCTCQAGALASQAKAGGVSVCAFGKTNGPSLPLVRTLARKLREHGVHVLHAHNALVLHYAVAAARLAGVPVVINTRHGGNMNWDPKCERIWRWAVRFTDRVVFVSEGVRNFYVEKDKLSTRNLEVIYNGIDVNKFSARQARPGANLPRIRFGAVGRQVPAKNHVGLVRAFHSVLQVLPDAELHLLGDGPCRKQIADTAGELNIANRVFLHGAGFDVAGFLSTLDIFVLSSLDEGLPISLMEAMAAGLPVVSTRLPGLVELAPESVVAGYCEPGSHEALGALMLQTALRHDLSAVGAKAQQWAERFGIESSWRRYEMLYHATLEKKGMRTTPREPAGMHLVR